jgi:hypothetical protein
MRESLVYAGSMKRGLIGRFRLILPLSSPTSSSQAYHPVPTKASEDAEERTRVESLRPEFSEWVSDMYT